jgi:hypothetical protein
LRNELTKYLNYRWIPSLVVHQIYKQWHLCIWTCR